MTNQLVNAVNGCWIVVEIGNRDAVWDALDLGAVFAAPVDIAHGSILPYPSPIKRATAKVVR